MSLSFYQANLELPSPVFIQDLHFWSDRLQTRKPSASQATTTSTLHLCPPLPQFARLCNVNAYPLMVITHVYGVH